jgi:hypothetical protein
VHDPGDAYTSILSFSLLSRISRSALPTSPPIGEADDPTGGSINAAHRCTFPSNSSLLGCFLFRRSRTRFVCTVPFPLAAVPGRNETTLDF